MVIDGWGIGPEGGCGTTDACEWGRSAAVRELDATYPGHAPVVSVTPHQSGAVTGPDGDKVLPMFGSLYQHQLWVLTLADGSRHAFNMAVPLPSDVLVGFCLSNEQRVPLRTQAPERTAPTIGPA